MLNPKPAVQLLLKNPNRFFHLEVTALWLAVLILLQKTRHQRFLVSFSEMHCDCLEARSRFPFRCNLSGPPCHLSLLMETAQQGILDTCRWCFLSCPQKIRRQKHHSGESTNPNQSRGRKPCHKLKSRRRLCCFHSNQSKHQRSVRKAEMSPHMVI